MSVRYIVPGAHSTTGGITSSMLLPFGLWAPDSTLHLFLPVSTYMLLLPCGREHFFIMRHWYPSAIDTIAVAPTHSNTFPLPSPQSDPLHIWTAVN